MRRNYLKEFIKENKQYLLFICGLTFIGMDLIYPNSYLLAAGVVLIIKSFDK